MNPTAATTAGPDLVRRGGHRIGGHLFLPSFAVMRTPYLSGDELVAWGDGLEATADPEALRRDRKRLRERLRALVQRPAVREAIHLASPDLQGELDRWLSRPDDPKLAGVEAAVVRYVQRMAGRCTPFGLFAGCSLVEFGDSTHLATAAQTEYRRRTRLDMDYLTQLVDALAADPELQDEMIFLPNDSLYGGGERLRYVESRVDGHGRNHLLVSAERDEFLAAALTAAADGARPWALAQAVATVDPEVDPGDARGFVGELITAQILVPELAVTVTGDDPLRRLLERMDGVEAFRPYAAALGEADRILCECDRAGPGIDPAVYERLAETLRDLPAPIDAKRLVQVDLWKPAPEATISPRLTKAILRGVDVLHALQPHRPQGPFDDFVQAFSERYGDRAVPLSEVLDEEAGIGFQRNDSPTADGSPLLAGLPFAGGGRAGAADWRPIHGHLLRLMQDATGKGEIEIRLDSEDVERYAEPNRRPMPDAFSLLATVAGRPGDEPEQGARVRLQAVVGPSGAKLLGRFCALDASLTDRVREHLAAEAAQRPEAVFAEIVHLPEGRVGNILHRPVLRDHEIHYLGRSGADPEGCIAVSDLLVSVDGGRVRLWSRRLGCEVVPRLSTAHNFVDGAVGVYKFLCLLQGQDVANVLAWNWGPLADAGFLPRVVCGPVVLSLATWNLTSSDIETLTSGGSTFAAAQELRRRRGLPRHVTVVEGDNTMPVDLDNALSVDVLCDLLRGRRSAQLTEQFPAPGEDPAHGPEGVFAHELVVPFNRALEGEAHRPAARTGPPVPRLAADHAPGSEWLFAKIYCGPATADRLLGETIRPLAARLLESGACNRWFFIRYGDPDWHLRLRFRGDPTRLAGEVLPCLHEALAGGLADGSVWRLALDTYQREVARYGGTAGLDLSEAFFQADSEAVARIATLASGDAGAGSRWLLGLYGVDRMLANLGLDVVERLETIRPMQDTFRGEFGSHRFMRKKLSEKYRRHRARISALLADGAEQDRGTEDGRNEDVLAEGCRIIDAANRTWADAARGLRELEAEGRLGQPLDQIGAAFAHMHLNRMLRSAARAHEMVIYEFLCREYGSRIARRGKAARA